MKIKTLLLLYVFNVLVLACTHSPALQREGELYTAYKNYAELLNSNNQYTSDQLFAALTLRKQEHLLNASKKTPDLLNELADNYLTFPLWIAKEFNHYETDNGDNGCLLINGYNQQLEPVAITISYHNASQWLIDDLHVEHLAPFNRFLKQAVCDRRKLDKIRFAEMM